MCVYWKIPTPDEGIILCMPLLSDWLICGWEQKDSFPSGVNNDKYHPHCIRCTVGMNTVNYDLLLKTSYLFKLVPYKSLTR